VAGCNTPLSPTDRPSKINKETSELNDTTEKRDLTDINKIFYPTTMKYTFFLTTHRSYFRT
jgi:hypothetical protein